jgi:hypothetical protein
MTCTFFESNESHCHVPCTLATHLFSSVCMTVFPRCNVVASARAEASGRHDGEPAAGIGIGIRTTDPKRVPTGSQSTVPVRAEAAGMPSEASAAAKATNALISR